MVEARNEDAELTMAHRWLERGSNCVCWQDLAADLVAAIDLLESRTARQLPAEGGRAILLRVDLGQHIIFLSLCDPGAQSQTTTAEGVRLRFSPLPGATDQRRDDGASPPNASVDRAVSKAAADMVSWSKDPDTFELIETRRFKLFLAWDQGPQAEVDEFAYGLWDE